MGIIAWIILGGLAGWIASLLTNTDEQMGIFANIIVGIVGALIGGFLMGLLGGNGITGFNLWSLLVAIVGAFVLLMLVKAFRRAT
jgi:uncharacterized membrane protein YeaQ/YmgE (transglycosylase-associated protein family)